MKDEEQIQQTSLQKKKTNPIFSDLIRKKVAVDFGSGIAVKSCTHQLFTGYPGRIWKALFAGDKDYFRE